MIPCTMQVALGQGLAEGSSWDGSAGTCSEERPGTRVQASVCHLLAVT